MNFFFHRSSYLHHVVESVSFGVLGRWLCLCSIALLLRVWHIGRHAKAGIQLLRRELLIQLVQLTQQFILVELDIIRASHALVDLLHVCHHICHVVEQVLHLVHIHVLHHCLLLSVGLLQGRYRVHSILNRLLRKRHLVNVELLIHDLA